MDTSTSIFQEGMPATAKQLVDALDEEIPNLSRHFDITLLADGPGEAERLKLAVQFGERQLVDRLKALLARDLQTRSNR